MGTYTGRWDCTTCGHRGILGPETTCPNCGASRPPNVRFYLPEDAEQVSSAEEEAAARAGVDWICGHCGTQNKAAHTRCRACDNPRDDSSDDVDLQERSYSLEELPTGSFAPKRTLHPDEQVRPARKRRAGMWILALILLLGGGWMALRTFPKHIEVKVVSFAWERQIQLLHNEVVSKEDWKTPSGAFDVQSFRAVRSYKQVLRGYETKSRTVRVQVGTERYVCGKIDKGNGYFVDKYCTRPVYENRQETYEAPIYDQVPVYGTKYRFKVREWVARDKNIIRTSGNNQAAKWPEDNRLNRNEEWKEGKRQARYRVTVREPNGTEHVEQMSLQQWEAIKMGQSLPAKKAYLFGTWYGLGA